MRKIFYILTFVFSTSLYAQASIETDQLYLKYEAEYLDNSDRAKYGRAYEESASDFQMKFGADQKRIKAFNESKDKERWLQRNYSKLSFESAQQAVDLYNSMLTSKQNLDAANDRLKVLYEELKTKYDHTLIWQTLQNRIKQQQ